MALFDLQRRFLIQVGHSKIQMYVQIICSVAHILWNYILVNKLSMGVVGSGLSSILTNFLLLLGNVLLTNYQENLKDACKVSICEKQVFKNVY